MWEASKIESQEPIVVLETPTSVAKAELFTSCPTRPAKSLKN